MAALAQSIEDNMGVRVKKLESFVGVNLSQPSSYTVPVSASSANPTVVAFGVVNSYNFNDGMTVNADGSVTIITPGIYQINFNANFLATGTTAARINTYLYKNTASIQYSSTYGETATTRYSNCNISGVYKLVAGENISARVVCLDATSSMVGSSFSLALTTRS